jgi:hypothetical protein
MPSWLKLILVALAAFGIGCTVASRFSPADPAPADDLAREKVGTTVQLTAKTPGESYLIVQGGAGKADPFSQGASPAGSWPRWSVETAESITLKQFPIAVYRAVPISQSLSYKCVGADCPPPPGKPPLRRTRFIVLIPGPS